MSLPILPSHRSVSVEDLIRLYHKTERHWNGQVAEETQLDCGTAFTNAQLGNVHVVNRMVDASLADGQSPAEAVAEADAHFRAQGVRCFKWVLNPAVPAARTAPLGEHLLGIGMRRDEWDIMYLAGQPAMPIEEVAGLQIIPARASFRHARALLEEATAVWKEPQLVEEGMLHLEDPQTDALIAIKDGVAAALVSVLTIGEIGCIEELYVAERLRRQGIGRTMVSRALEICARSVFKHVFLEVDTADIVASSLYARFGFRPIGRSVSYGVPHDLP